MIAVHRRVLPKVSEVRSILETFHQAARERGVSTKKQRIYRTWITGFLWWCISRPPHRASPRRIQPFLRAVRRHPDSETVHEAQATGALDFLFGPVSARLKGKPSLFASGTFADGTFAGGTSGLGGSDASGGTGASEASAFEASASEGNPSEENASEESPASRPSAPLHAWSSETHRPRSNSGSAGGGLGGERETLRLSLTSKQVQRLRHISGHLELPLELVAERALQMVCQEAGVPREVPPSKERRSSTGTLLYQNQARKELLSQQPSGGESSGQERSPQKGSGKQNLTLGVPEANLRDGRRLPGFETDTSS